MLLVSGFWSLAAGLWLDYQQEARGQEQVAGNWKLEINLFGPVHL